MTMPESSCAKAKRYWKVGIQYLHIAETVSSEIVKHDNASHVVSDREISIGELEERTRWADHNVVLPLLFNFYHGLEVILKGFLISRGGKTGGTHKLSKLSREFKNAFQNEEPVLVEIFEKYLDGNQPEPLAAFLDKSGIAADDFYQSFKYPESRNGLEYVHLELMYRGNEGVSFFHDLNADIIQICGATVRLGRTICPRA